MSFWSILESLLIGPLKLVFEIIFEFANRFIGHPGLAIIVLSLIMNILVLPLYRRADAMQEASRDVEAKLSEGASHIKKTFKGDERMMILQTYYRQNNYKPTDALNGSVSLLLEIPFFMAAYQFLSHLDILDGVTLGPIKDLGAPDGLLVIGGLAINVLPFLMTFINVISSALYLKGFPLKTKIQLYGMALFFLVFLYTSPSCLVFYWTLNNLFSLVKTIFYKIKNPQLVLKIMTFIMGLGSISFGGFIYETDSLKRKLLLIAIGVALVMPLTLSLVKGKDKKTSEEREVPKNNKKIFVAGGIFMTVLVGLLIPSTFIAASPQEYVDVTMFHNPLWFVVSAVCLAAGTFLVWMGVFYWLASPKGKVLFDRLIWVLCGVALINYMFFGTKLGVISSALQYEAGLNLSMTSRLVNLGVVIVCSAVLYFFAVKWKKAVSLVLVTAVIALGGMSVVNMVKINSAVTAVKEVQMSEEPHYSLSEDGKNVVVIMLDRAMGEYVPYMMNEKPELKEQFDGFTYYKNTISFGGFTNFGAPALLGGYEYTPVEMNKRGDELLVDKHNEAVKLMPVIFSDEGYDVTVCDPVYPNYQWVPDLTLFDEYPEINKYITKGRFGNVEGKEAVIRNNYRNFFCFGIMKTMPLFIQPTIYNNGQYNRIIQNSDALIYSTQNTTGTSTAEGLSSYFMEPYNVLLNLENMTKIIEEGNTFLFFSNDTTHEPMLLQEPQYEPAWTVDNREYDEANKDRFTVDGKEIVMDSAYRLSHYQANMAALMKLGEWFDYLRETGVYDNTRIILVSDHGRDLGHFPEMMLDDGSGETVDTEFYYPLLMVKDFDSEGFTTSDEFMTNADVPVMAFDGLVEAPVNPFTGNEITDAEKYSHEQFIIRSDVFDVEKNNGYTYLPSKWASVKDDIFDKDNWTFYNEETVISDHVDP
ncbi:MAG: hypothetical protein E7660_07490 [Ruminococcaceae bacterium]|nr:hypothetical protein [Oscillospiraceae bacterium]